MLKRIGIYFAIVLVVCTALFFTIAYYATYSEGDRTGELIKFSKKGYVFKTWEGEISQGIAGAQIFKFSVLDNDEEVIAKLKENQGQYVKVSYVERYTTFPWWGDTKYYITGVQKEQSPFKLK